MSSLSRDQVKDQSQSRKPELCGKQAMGILVQLLIYTAPSHISWVIS